MAEIKLRIDGMHCGSCVRRVTQTLALAEGIQVGEVRVGEARFTSSQDPAPIDLLIDKLAKAGFTAHLEA
jgi:copper chaperone CopZ